MRVLKSLLVVLTISGIIFLSVSCGGSGTTTAATSTATVKLGNIAITVTGTGNLALENKQELSFGQTGLVSNATTAKISEVDVVAGQTVTKGQVLVKADPTDWQDQITSDQHTLDSDVAAVATAKANVAQAQANVITDQANLVTDQDNLVKAIQNLNAQTDIQTIQTKIDNANIQLQQAKLMLQLASKTGNSADVTTLNEEINYLSVDTGNHATASTSTVDGGEIGVLRTQLANLEADPAHAGASTVTDATSATAIETDVLAVQQAQQKIITDQNTLALAQASVITNQNSVITSQNKVTDAQNALSEDQSAAQEIVAPFDGLITEVNVSQGQIAERSATLIEIADPSKYEANIMVTETDSESIKIGDSAKLTFTALTGKTFQGQITQIAPLATVSSGVVNYQVTVEMTSLTPVSTSQTSQSYGSSSGTGAASSGSASATRTYSGTPTAGGDSGSSGSSAASTTTTTTAITLRDGLSTTVTIPIQEVDNVLYVPARAITRQGGNSTAQVVKGTTTQTVTIQTGLTDGTNTQVVSGLSQGDTVILKSTSTSTSQGFGGGGGLRLP